MLFLYNYYFFFSDNRNYLKELARDGIYSSLVVADKTVRHINFDKFRLSDKTKRASG